MSGGILSYYPERGHQEHEEKEDEPLAALFAQLGRDLVGGESEVVRREGGDQWLSDLPNDP